ncbi:Signal transducer and activator of transcription b [Aphelenchoides fujianensis]|nr:Signal transducer and activator of transcription b [Aphelenchoides fujianensis]KAI6226302.1 Signal transducer and activator of transcription b [Aphelenchoides fujianensis]
MSSSEYAMDCATDFQSPFPTPLSSPAAEAAARDPDFVAKHNNTADFFKVFVHVVDLLSAYTISIHDQAQLFSRLDGTLDNLLDALKTKKNYLLNEVLCNWAVRQQKLTIACLWTQQQHYALLSSIDAQFELFGQLLEQTLSQLGHLIGLFPTRRYGDSFERVLDLATDFLYYSIVVSKQPPPVVVKCGEAKQHKRYSRFWFDTEIRVLGGRAFGLHASAENLPVHCQLVTDDTAERLYANADYEVFEDEHFLLQRRSSAFHTHPISGLASKFNSMFALKKDDIKRPFVVGKRYCLCYGIRLNAKYGIELIGKKISLPFALLVAPNAQADAVLFLERSFADLVRKPLSKTPTAMVVSWAEMADALEMSFQSFLKPPQKANEPPSVVKPRAFEENMKHHLIQRLEPDSNGQIKLENFTQLMVAEKYRLKKRSQTEREWQLVPFYEWFFKTAEMINKHMRDMWNNGLIVGFCAKEKAKQMLRACPYSTLLVRFSDFEFGRLKVSVKNQSGAIQHCWYEQKDLEARPLKRELLTNRNYSNVEFIFPDYPLRESLGGVQRSNSCAQKSRKIQYALQYFENECSACSS